MAAISANRNRDARLKGQGGDQVSSRKKYTRRIWTPQEINYLKMIYPDVSTEDIAKSLNRSVSQVYSAANIRGLKKSEKYMKEQKGLLAEKLKSSGKAYRFKKGSTPANKGKRMSPDHYERAKASMFKKGHVPHNTNYDGHIRISQDGYQEIRIRKGKYRLLHLHNWEQVHGQLPKGHCLRAKDGNRDNVDPANWELITRAENMLKNSIHRFPAELKSTMKILSKLKRKIDEKQN